MYMFIHGLWCQTRAAMSSSCKIQDNRWPPISISEETNWYQIWDIGPRRSVCHMFSVWLSILSRYYNILEAEKGFMVWRILAYTLYRYNSQLLGNEQWACSRLTQEPRKCGTVHQNSILGAVTNVVKPTWGSNPGIFHASKYFQPPTNPAPHFTKPNSTFQTK